MNYSDYFSCLVNDEGSRGCAYDDATGVNLRPGYQLEGNATIGVGEYIGPDSPLENDLINFLAMYRIHKYVGELKKLPFWHTLDVARRSVLVGMMFNLGIRGFFEFQKMLLAIHEEDYVEASVQIKESLAYRQDSRRYGRYADIMLSGEFTSTCLNQPVFFTREFLQFLENFKGFI